MFDRASLLKDLESTKFWDVIIIGGGATGLGIALDATTRGYKTLLLEQSDYAKGTSSRSTKLVHGGVRYLQQGNIDLVREALYERGLLLKNANHLVRKQAFIIPSYKWWQKTYYLVGLKLYDFLSGKLSFGASKRVSKKEIELRLKHLKRKDLRGGIEYFDGQFDDARLAINIAQTAIEQGATLLNYFKVKDISKNQNQVVDGVTAVDVETNLEYNLKSKVVINATGVFTDSVLKMDNSQADKLVRPSQGIHLVVDRSFLESDDAIMIPKTDDGRVLFLVPWHDKVIMGTTDSLLEEALLEPQPMEKEIDFILQTANAYLSKSISREDVLSVFTGLRPLAAPKNNTEKTKEVSRSHKIIVSDSELITITGGKWTTYRRMAQDVIDKVISLNKLEASECRTRTVRIHGAYLDEQLNGSYYGTDKNDIENLIEKQPELKEKLHAKLPYTKAEVVWAANNEMARTIEDVLARRNRLLFLDARKAIEVAPLVGSILQNELGKTDEWKQNQIDAFNKLAANYTLN